MPRVQPKPPPPTWRSPVGNGSLTLDRALITGDLCARMSMSSFAFFATTADAREIAAELIRLADEADAKGAK